MTNFFLLLLLLLPVHYHENQPRRGNPEPQVKVHPEPEEGGLQDVHLSHQREPGQHFAAGRPSDRQPPSAHEDNGGLS